MSRLSLETYAYLGSACIYVGQLIDIIACAL